MSDDLSSSPQASGPVVGIDLGTTNSVVAAVVNGRAEVLCEDGTAILPSVVGLDAGGNLVTGEVARNQIAALPDQTIASVKRHMGSMEPLKLGTETFSPPEISAMILRRLRDRATAVLGTEVTRAVITVPAFFDENQRQATREAGRLAGLEVLRIINEPTAATLVYHAGGDQRKQIVVYDFGGGTFDVSVVRIESGVVEVLSSQGDTHLGGDDLDATLMNWVAEEFINQHAIDLRKTASSRWRLIRACEKAKCELSDNESATIREEFIAEKNGQPLHLSIDISRRGHEKLIATLIDKTIACVDAAMEDSKLRVSDLDDLVLVGGSTRIPLVEERLRSELKLNPSRSVDPDLAVALGAATQAAMLDGQSVGPVLVDVTSHTLGIVVAAGFSFDGPNLRFSPIIRRGTALPARHEEAYHAVHDEQKIADIQVMQGEHSDIDRNQDIGQFELPLTDPSGDRGKVVVRFDLTLDGTLTVSARQRGTDQRETLTINNALSQFQDEDRAAAKKRLGTMFESSEALAVGEQDRLNWLPPGSSDAEDADDTGDDPLQAIAQRAREVAARVDGEDAEELARLSNELEAAVAAENEDETKRIQAELEDILFYVDP